MYFAVVLVIAFSGGTSAFQRYCNQNVTLNKQLIMITEGDINSVLLNDGVCRFVVRPSHEDMLMVGVVDTSYPRDRERATQQICSIIKIKHRGNTYDFCDVESLPALEHEVVIEVLGEWTLESDIGKFWVMLTMTVFYPAQCQLDEEMCEAQEDDTASSCLYVAPVDLSPLDQIYVPCTDQEAQECPHKCRVCSQGTAEACCFNGQHQRDDTEDTWSSWGDHWDVDSMGICSSHPYGCSKLECDDSCGVGKANGPYCVAVKGAAIAYGGGMEGGGGWGYGRYVGYGEAGGYVGGAGGYHGGGAGGHGGGAGGYGGGVHGGIVDGEDDDGHDDGAGKKSDTDGKSEAGANVVCRKWAVVAGVMIVWNA